MENMKNIKDKFFLGRHQKMERFSLGFFVLSILLVFTMVVGFRQNMIKNSHLISDKAMYNELIQTSKTHVQGTVLGVYGNKTHTKSLVLLHFPDINKISTDAKNYNVFVTSADVDGNQRRFTSKPTGGVYVFGDTGYVGLYLVNNAGFDKQILQVTVRANLELVAKDNANSEEKPEGKEGDTSFAKFDQFTIYCNPGASQVEYIKALEGEGSPDASILYRDAVSDKETLLAKEINKKQLENIEIALNNVKEHTKRIEKRGVVIPNLPEVLVGDTISREKKGEKIVYKYNVKNDFKGALHFDWQNKSIQDGFVKDAMKNYKNLTVSSGKDFLVAQALDAKENPTSLNLNIKDWKLKDGRLIEDLNTETNSNDEYVSLNKACQDYVKVLDDYYKLKLDYQTKTQVDFIRSEVLLGMVSDLQTTYFGDDVVTVY